MRKIWREIQHFLDTIERVRTATEVVAMVAVVGIAIRQWVHNLDLFQLRLLLIVIACVAIVCVTYIVEWRRKNKQSEVGVRMYVYKSRSDVTTVYI